MQQNYMVLKALRHTHHETQPQCAKRLRVTQATISAWESPTSGRLHDRQLSRICIAYSVNENRAQQCADRYAADMKKKREAKKPYDALRKMYRVDDVIWFDENGESITLLMALDTVLRDKKLPESVGKSMIGVLESVINSN